MIWNSHLLNKISDVKSTTLLCMGNLMQKLILPMLSPGYIEFFTVGVERKSRHIWWDKRKHFPVLNPGFSFLSFCFFRQLFEVTKPKKKEWSAREILWKVGPKGARSQSRFMAFLANGSHQGKYGHLEAAAAENLSAFIFLKGARLGILKSSSWKEGLSKAPATL